MKKDDAKRCVGPGWATLIDELFDRMPDGASVFSVKEKYGGLRIDGIGTSDLEIELGERSQTICEECGEPGEVRNLNWIRTLCDEHYESRRGLGGSVA